MSAREQEMETLKQEGKKREAGVAELVELYKRIEPFYARAARRARPARRVFMSDSTNLGRARIGDRNQARIEVNESPSLDGLTGAG